MDMAISGTGQVMAVQIPLLLAPLLPVSLTWSAVCLWICTVTWIWSVPLDSDLLQLLLALQIWPERCPHGTDPALHEFDTSAREQVVPSLSANMAHVLLMWSMFIAHLLQWPMTICLVTPLTWFFPPYLILIVCYFVSCPFLMIFWALQGRHGVLHYMFIPVVVNRGYTYP